MKIGIHLPQMGGGTAEEIARVAIRAEHLTFDREVADDYGEVRPS